MKKTIDCTNHPETKALMRSMNAAPAPRRATPGIEAMRQQASQTIAAVKSIGLAPVVAGAAAYLGHIRQMDAQRQAQRSPRKVQVGIERLEER